MRGCFLELGLGEGYGVQTLVKIGIRGQTRVTQKWATKGRRDKVNEWTAPPRGVDRVSGKKRPKMGSLVNFGSALRPLSFQIFQMHSKHGGKMGSLEKLQWCDAKAHATH